MVVCQPLDDLTNDEFEQLIDRYIERSAQWDGTLPLDSMLETWAEIERRKEPLLVRVRLIDGQIALETPPETTHSGVGRWQRVDTGI